MDTPTPNMPPLVEPHDGGLGLAQCLYAHGAATQRVPLRRQQHDTRERYHRQRCQTLYELNTSPHSVCEWLNSTAMGFDPLLFGNMVSLCEGISPRVVGSVCREFYPTTGEPSLAMRMLWETLDHPFGTAVHLMHPVTLCPHKSPERTVYYTPYLSGIAVRANASSPYWSGKSKGASPSSSSTATA